MIETQSPQEVLPLSSKSCRIMDEAKELARRQKTGVVTTEGFTHSLLHDKSVQSNLAQLRVDHEKIRSVLFASQSTILGNRQTRLIAISDEVRQAIQFATQEARRQGSSEINPLHLLIGVLLLKKENQVTPLLTKSGVSLEKLRRITLPAG